MILYVRKKPTWINYVSSVDELNQFIESFEGRLSYSKSNKVPVLGDVTFFTKAMMNILLKFIEENPNVDLYSSTDLDDLVLLSRIPKVVKDVYDTVPSDFSTENYLDSPKDYQSVYMNLYKLPNSLKLRSTKLTQRQLTIVTNMI